MGFEDQRVAHNKQKVVVIVVAAGGRGREEVAIAAWEIIAVTRVTVSYFYYQ